MPGQVRALRELVDGYIQERLKPKLEDLDKQLARQKDPAQVQDLRERRDKLLADYQRDAWLANAAVRGKQVRDVTHALKYLHPDARGSNLNIDAGAYSLPEFLVGTACLGRELASDAVGNAAALDVYNLLKLEHEGRSLLDLLREASPALAAALHDDPGQATELMQGLAAVTATQEPASHTLARQVYFPLPQGGYHLLAPLYPSSLVHAMYQELREARFSPQAREARQARKDGKPHPEGYSDYPNLAVLVFGGSKPQNISQLNAERHGESWLLPSLPPNWGGVTVRPPLGISTVFGPLFGRRLPVRQLVNQLAGFLASTTYNNLAIREKRAELVDRICDHLVQFAAELQDLEPGWSADPQCKLDQVQALWLDPGRAESDEAFAALRAGEDWQTKVAADFGAWLNQALRRKQKGLHLGDDEQEAWAQSVGAILEEPGEERPYA